MTNAESSVRHCALLALLPLLAAPAMGQAGERVLTGSNENHNFVQISPDGNWVACMRSSGLSIVPWAGGAEQTVVPSTTMSPYFLWTPSSSGFVYQDGNNVRITTRDGTSTRQLAMVPGAQRLWDIDSTGSKVFGVRKDAAAVNPNIVFVVATAGGPFTDVLDDIDGIEDVDVDQTDSWLLFRTTGLFQWQFWRATTTGAGRASFGSAPFHLISQGGHWIGPGDRMLFYSVNSAAPQGVQLATMDFATSTVTFLTALPGQRYDPVPSSDLGWLLYEFTEPTGGVRTVRLLPATGGGEITVSSQLQSPGPVSISTNGVRIAYGGTQPTKMYSHVRVNELEREIRVSPKLETGKSSTFRIPAMPTETVFGFLSFKALAAPVPAPPFTGMFELDPGLLFFPIVGTGEQAVPLAIPADASLVGAYVYFQGLRLASLIPLAGGFTRSANARVF